MRFATLSIFFLTILLLVTTPKMPPNFHKRVDPLREEFNERLKSSISDKELRSVLISYSYGGSEGISRLHKRAHRDLALLHLFTPSGVHLTALLVPILFLLRRGTKSEKVRRWISVIIFLSPLFLSGFYCLKRMGVWRVLLMLTPLSSLGSFFVTFTTDYFLGSYLVEPLSFIYSFLFFGTLLSLTDRPKIFVPIGLLFGQLLVAYFCHAPISIFGFFIGMILTFLFAPLFPLFLVTLFIPTLSSISIPLLKCYLFLIEKSYVFIKIVPYTFASIPLLLIGVITFFPWSIKRRVRYSALFVLLLIHSDPLYNPSWQDTLKLQTFNSKYVIFPKEELIKKRVVKGRSIHLNFDDHGKGRCIVKLYDGFYEKECHYLKKRGPRKKVAL